MFGRCLGCLGPEKVAKKKGRPLWKRWTTRNRNADGFSKRVVRIGNGGGDGDFEPEENEDNEDKQTQFVGNDIKTSKYTIWSFIPRNLFEQFRRIANIYFAVVGFIQLLIDSPVSPFTSISPLVFVVVVTMLKQGYEDFLRHRADNFINNKLVTKLNDVQVEQIQSKKIQVGDILCIENEDELPCDLLLLSTSNPTGKASVLTANLDGETNLKIFSASVATRNLRQHHELQHMRSIVECENPNPDLGRFVGRIKVLDQNGQVSVYPLGPENIVWRGTRLKNTDFVYGCAIYTGRDSKMSQNSKLKSNKFSSIEVILNRYLAFFLSLLVVEIVVATSLRYTRAIDEPDCELGSFDSGSTPWYMGTDIQVNGKGVAQDTLSFLVLFNYIIPISLYVTLEFQKFFGSFFLIWDLDIYDEINDTPAKCNTSDLNEELGNVEILFSDKTGTLTENVMVFRECSIDGVLFFDDNENLVSPAEKTNRLKRSVRKFLEVLALCHTVQAVQMDIPEDVKSTRNPHHLVYHASSPDEKAIVEACRNYGVTFLGEHETDSGSVDYQLMVSMSSKTKRIVVERIQVLEFDSHRKCMSVLIKDSKGRVKLLTKGAESSIIPKCSNTKTNPRFVQRVLNHIDGFASKGLRTLAVATKEFSESEYLDFRKRLDRAERALDRREERLRQVYESAESNMELIGAIGIEDKLQEGVKETLVSLGIAGIKVWILTGDKKETAINISSSCGHYRPNMTLLDVTGLKTPEAAESVLVETLNKRNINIEKPACLIIDGTTILSVFGDVYEKTLSSTFLDLATKCDSVICCRMSPLQKSEVVRLVKETGVVTAAIGDGANDVSMIQEAHVGLGIAGKEGRAAVRASDFAFSKFRFLKKVLLVHGHWFYYRAATLVQYFFYKNVAAFSAQFFFAFFNSYSSQTLYDSINLTLYNITYTSLPIFIFGLLEQNIKSDELLANPVLYQTISHNRLLSPIKGAIWFLEAVWHAVVTFFAFHLLWSYNCNSVPEEDVQMEMYSFGIAIYQSVMGIFEERRLLKKNYHQPLAFISLIL